MTLLAICQWECQKIHNFEKTLPGALNSTETFFLRTVRFYFKSIKNIWHEKSMGEKQVLSNKNRGVLRSENMYFGHENVRNCRNMWGNDIALECQKKNEISFKIVKKFRISQPARMEFCTQHIVVRIWEIWCVFMAQ